ncbi:LysR family transcriptional regulator [Ruegeria marina]|uniref:Transcriptional regulator, LysR family n=1 Tax=Ruegeria marina TaxID=639004 RepID=A0A1G7A790_9RHOB|nr:LysR family transcriptional regulator [Ruegeria marina]SDE10778.1 transcriptional regulator, LysR family [Ruegeria marina]
MPISPPRPRPLPLNALRAFEAAARLEGFAAAAEEIGVTPGAISAHVKQLEQALGAPLFVRTARGVSLTALALKVLPDLTRGFDALAAASRTLQSDAAPQVVQVVALPSVAQLWLSPRLPGLRQAAPEIEISVTAMEAPPDLKRAPYDLYLFFGDGPGEPLAPDVIFPVCAPGLASKLKRPADLANLPCLSDSSWSGDWEAWATEAMPGQRFAPRGPVFSLYALAVEEAVNGAGVLIGHEALVAPLLASGRLVAPFDIKVRLQRQLSLWSPRPIREGSTVDRVARWLRQGSAGLL